jgi:lactam utilization protein B
MPVIKHLVKINVDLGEGYGNFKCGPDDELIPLIDHANVACGFHAGYVRSTLQYRSRLQLMSPATH